MPHVVFRAWIHEFGHVWRIIKYGPQGNYDYTTWRDAGKDRRETHAQRWEAAYYREKYGNHIDIRVAVYQYLYDNLIISLIFDLIFYNTNNFIYES